MALNQDYIADKSIVGRTKPYRKREIAASVHRARERLLPSAGSRTFDREMLKIHARTIIRSAPAILILLFLIGIAGLTVGPAREMIIWGLLSLAGYTSLYLFARRVDRLSIEQIDTRRLYVQFWVMHFISGASWIYLVSFECSCGVLDFSFFVAIVLLMMIAVTALVCSSLRGAILPSFGVPVAIHAIQHLAFPLGVAPIMALLLILSLPFFAHVAHHRNRAAASLLSFRSENETLIAELETAKAVSDEARRRAEEANLAKSRFLASMSHELRTPLNAILGFSEVMAKEVLGPVQNDTYREYAKDVHQSGQHLLALINEILDLSRIEAGRYQLNEEPLALADVVHECCRMMELKAKAKGIRLIQRFEPTLSKLSADERALRQITLNLLSNAVKFTPSGGEIRVRVGWTAGGGQYISVQDNGPGIPSEEMPLVLSAFGQGSFAIKNAEQGTGLGLPIVQGLANLHGGLLQLKSKLREGTIATVIFPRSRVVDEPVLPLHQKRRAS